MRAKMTILVATLMVALTVLQAPVWAQGQDPNEGQPKHEINELQNRLHQTDDPSKQNHLEGKIDALQEREKRVNQQLEQLQQKKEGLSIRDMLELQLQFNKLSQLTEGTTAVTHAAHQASMSIARRIKG